MHRLTKTAQNLRKNMTKEERKLWYGFLRDLPYTVHRQKVIGEYIVDFYCPQARAVIEVDGSQHYEADVEERDKLRTETLQERGIAVYRYPNNAIQQSFAAVCEDIFRIFTERVGARNNPHPSADADTFPFAKGEGKERR